MFFFFLDAIKTYKIVALNREEFRFEHIKPKVFECYVCHKKFSFKCSMKRHLLLVHKQIY